MAGLNRATYDIDIYRGDSQVVEFRFSDEQPDGKYLPTDLSEIVVSGQVRYESNDPSVWIDLDPVITDALGGVVVVTITASESAAAADPAVPNAPLAGEWDLEFRAAGDPLEVFTPIKGKFTVQLDTTRS